jgi:hypothetical protein
MTALRAPCHLLRRVAVIVLAVAAPLAACDSSTRVNPLPAPDSRSYDCDTRGACGSFRLGAPNTDSRSTPGPSGEELRRDSPTM